MRAKLNTRDRVMVAAAGLAGPAVIRALGASWRLRVRGYEAVEAMHAQGRPVIYALWHGQLLSLEYAHRGAGICVMSSWHRDGELSARVLSGLGYEVVRGSTRRGSVRGLVGMLSKVKEGHDLAITPDGPKGPARIVKPGVLYLSERSGAPIVPLAVWSDRAKRLSSWDGFSVPLPFARVVVAHGDPIEPDPGAPVEARAEALAATLEALTDRASRLWDKAG